VKLPASILGVAAGPRVHCIERRRGERRTGQLDVAFGVVVFLR
jgi:hypothetical protein